MNLSNDRNKIIKLFEDRNIFPSNYAFDANLSKKNIIE